MTQRALFSREIIEFTEYFSNMENTSYINSLANFEKNDVFAGPIHFKECKLAPWRQQQPRLVGLKTTVFHYFEGHSELEVERHFKKVFLLPMDDSPRKIEPLPVPMRDRNLPLSFWRQDIISPPRNPTPINSWHPPHVRTPMIGRGVPTMNQSQYTTTGNPRFEGHHSRVLRCTKQSNNPFQNSAKKIKLTHVQINERPICSVANATALRYGQGPRAGHGFNPRYNFMLIQPDVKPQLPLVRGQQRGNGNRKG